MKYEDVRKGLGPSLVRNWKKLSISVLAAFVLGSCYLVMKLAPFVSPKSVPYSDLVVGIESGQVTEVLLQQGSNRVFYNTQSHTYENRHDASMNDYFQDSNSLMSNGKMASLGMGNILMGSLFKGKIGRPEWQFTTRMFDDDKDFLVGLVREKEITYSCAPRSILVSMTKFEDSALTLWLPMAPLIWLLYRQFSDGNRTARRWRRNKQTISFDDVEGVDAAKAELMEIVSCLQGTTNYKKLGAKLPKGVLLVGPPGTGKTLLARAVAGEAAVPFFIVSASEFVELFVGRGAARIRDLFKQARKCSPSIIFIDELDAIGGKRGRRSNDEADHTLIQLLTEMDGFESDRKVVVMAATNRPEALDPALCRPGRFSRKVNVGLPDLNGRHKILAVHMKNIPLEGDLYHICDLVASLTAGLVGADLANIVNEAALLAARRGGETVCQEDFLAAVGRAKDGTEENGSETDLEQ